MFEWQVFHSLPHVFEACSVQATHAFTLVLEEDCKSPELNDIAPRVVEATHHAQEQGKSQILHGPARAVVVLRICTQCTVGTPKKNSSRGFSSVKEVYLK